MASAAGPKIVEVAERILADIQERKLRPGDAYLSTAETAQWLRVNGATVNRALQLLSQRGVICRRQRRGTVIADPADRATESPLKRVHLLVREDHLRAEGLWTEGVLLGLQGALPGAEIQFNFRPEVDEADYVRQLIHDVLGSKRTAGLVLIRSTVVSQRLVVASGLPAVVSGTLQPSIRDLPSVDRDQRQIGVLLAEYLLRARCRNFLILMRERLTAGDHAMLDGALATLAAAGVALDALKLRCLPTDEEAIVAATQDLVAGLRGRVGCLCRSEALAQGVRDRDGISAATFDGFARACDRGRRYGPAAFSRRGLPMHRADRQSRGMGRGPRRDAGGIGAGRAAGTVSARHSGPALDRRSTTVLTHRRVFLGDYDHAKVLSGFCRRFVSRRRVGGGAAVPGRGASPPPPPPPGKNGPVHGRRSGLQAVPDSRRCRDRAGYGAGLLRSEGGRRATGRTSTSTCGGAPTAAEPGSRPSKSRIMARGFPRIPSR